MSDDTPNLIQKLKGGPSRRAILGMLGTAALTVNGGCLRRLQTLFNRDAAQTVSLSIKTVPADIDSVAVTIARQLAEHLESAGIRSEVVPMARNELLRDVLINHDFDAYVIDFPGLTDPDELRTLVGSRFAEETGWQNPFGVTDLTLDDHLEDQRNLSGPARRAAVSRALEQLVRVQPFTTVAVPEDIRAVRKNRYRNWNSHGFANPLTYLSVDPAEEFSGEPAPSDRTMTLVSTNSLITQNLNPIAVEYRGRGTTTSLLYDSLVRRTATGTVPWLASRTDWRSTENGMRVVVELRDDITWHDGSALTASDVAFTYRFLQDTSLGNQESDVPTPRFRSETSIVTNIEVVNESALELSFSAARPVAKRALTVPILPERVWRPLSVEAEVAGVEVAEGTTEALIWQNPDPIGSGPLQVDSQVAGELLALTRFEDHFLYREELGDLSQYRPPYSTLDIRMAPSSVAAVELVAAERADATATSLEADAIPRVARNEDLEQVGEQSTTFYHVGFNVRQSPLSNIRFRRTVVRLLDKARVAESTLGTYGEPAATPLAGTEWVPSNLQWDGSDPEVPFLGSNGELDVAAARQAFRDAGYRYGENGRLISG